MASIPVPTSPHLYPQVNRSRPLPPIGLVEEVLVRSAHGAKKLLPAWSRAGVATPDGPAPAGTLARSRSQLDMVASAADATSADSALRSSSRASRQLPEQRQSTFARALLHKSSRLLQKRKSTPKLRSTPTVSVWDDDDEPVPLSLPSLLQKAQPQPLLPPIRKESISEPFNFQHITHTNSKHAKTLQDVRTASLSTEFCALRAAQKPLRELKGIKADDLPSATQSEAASLASPSTLSVASRPTTPGRLHSSKSVDNFRLACTRSFSAPLGPVIPPPRKSSRKPVNLATVVVDTSAPPALDSPTLPTPISAATARSPDSRFPTAASTPATEVSVTPTPVEIAQAVTTPDDSAYEMAPRKEIESSEDEAKPRTPERTSSNSLRHSRSMPTVKHFSRIWASSTSLASSTDPTLPSPDRTANAEELPVGPRRSSMAPKVLHESWEDSVDYCYDYAMDEHEVESEGGLTMDPTRRCQTAPQGAITPAMTDSANSSALSFPGIPTPSLPSPGLAEGPRALDGDALFPLSPSLLGPKEFSSRMTHEEHYDQRLDLDFNDTNYSSFFFPALDFPALDLPAFGVTRGSPRSSRTPLSKSSSHDSFASRHHTGSGGSTPSLVRGKASREQLSGYCNASAAAAEFNSAVRSASTIPDAIDCMRRDLIRAAEEMPDAQFAAAISPTLTPPPSRMTIRTACPSPENSESERDEVRPMPTVPVKTRARAASAAQSHSTLQRGIGHRTSYSLFPAPVRC